jgi:hypothetical protein
MVVWLIDVLLLKPVGSFVIVTTMTISISIVQGQLIVNIIVNVFAFLVVAVIVV